MNERREGIRVALDVTVSEKLVSGTLNARVVSLSNTGMRYTKPSNIRRHGAKEVFLEFTLPGESESIKVLGWVVEEIEKENILETAVTFMFLPENDEGKINTYVNKHLPACPA
ncbi:MAG: PilZ domain-containing protein [Proteobacteria bacterium]|nr:PilZ domain-containing protein [Pseudomonadota bacterium]MBU1715681.1 PilZ domain-containing protein [Pseudomonadota bacterium]